KSSLLVTSSNVSKPPCAAARMADSCEPTSWATETEGSKPVHIARRLPHIKPVVRIQLLLLDRTSTTDSERCRADIHIIMIRRTSECSKAVRKVARACEPGI